jgi:hypothetical protein
MTDRERLEAIVAVVCQYLPPDGISKEEAMREIISLVDPLPEKGWVGLTDDEIEGIAKRLVNDAAYCSLHFAVAIQGAFIRKNNG